jgi:hypothetical protein
MRSLATQLVALVLAVPVAAVASSHPSSSHSSMDNSHLIFQAPLIEQPVKHRCHAYCQARKLRHQVRRVHGRTVALARRAALPDPPSPHLGWRRSSLRVQLRSQAHVLRRYRASAARPLRLRLARYGAWVCIHRHEAAWNDTGDPYWGGLQMDRGFMSAYAPGVLLRRGWADRWTALEQMWVAERAHQSGRGYWPWPNTARFCGLI